MICPWCNKATPKALHTQIGLIKTCEHCNNKFKVKFRIKEIIIYGLVVGAIAAIAGVFNMGYLTILIIACSLPFASKYVYYFEKVEKNCHN